MFIRKFDRYGVLWRVDYSLGDLDILTPDTEVYTITIMRKGDANRVVDFLQVEKLAEAISRLAVGCDPDDPNPLFYDFGDFAEKLNQELTG